jgi:hypothetical protein
MAPQYILRVSVYDNGNVVYCEEWAATGLADALDLATSKVKRMDDVTRELVDSYVVLRNNYQLLWLSACSIAKEFGADVPDRYKAAIQRAEKAIGAFRKVYGF